MSPSRNLHGLTAFRYWIWSKILENLASIGYDPAIAYTASYDWRLAYGNLEVRDQYFTRLKMVPLHATLSSGRISDESLWQPAHRDI